MWSEGAILAFVCLAQLDLKTHRIWSHVACVVKLSLIVSYLISCGQALSLFRASFFSDISSSPPESPAVTRILENLQHASNIRPFERLHPQRTPPVSWALPGHIGWKAEQLAPSSIELLLPSQTMRSLKTSSVWQTPEFVPCIFAVWYVFLLLRNPEYFLYPESNWQDVISIVDKYK